MGLFTPRQVRAVKAYEYLSENNSISEPHLYVVWNWLFKFVPATWAANTLTLLGILINIGTAFILLSYNPDGLRTVPGWVHLLRAAGVFAYLAFDALDGIQGRRTRDGALEELHDHGFDSLSTVFVGLGACFALQLAREPVLLLVMMCLAEFVFFTSTWQHYVTGVMRFWRIDASEANLAVILIHVICGTFPEALDRYIPVLNVRFRDACIIGNVILSVFLISRHLFYISKGPDKRTSSPIQNSGSAAFPIIPMALAFGLKVLVAMTTSAYRNNISLFLVCFGIAVSKLTVTLIMAHITKDSMPYFDWILIGPITLLINHHTGIMPENSLLWIVCIYNVLNWINYFRNSTIEICNHLNIYCYNVTSRPRERK